LQVAQGIASWAAGDLFPSYSGYTSACSFALSGLGATALVGSGTGAVGIEATNYCAWIATSDASWLTVNAGSSGVGNGVATFSVAANPGSSSRTGTLTLGGKPFLITQAGSGPASCDTTGDTSITVVNVQLVVNESLGLLLPVHDLNQDGAVDVVDIQKMLNRAIGLGCPA
jgi:hypothetical protein